MSTKILVTGGAGFIGSHVVDRLLDMGDKVVCVDSFTDNYDPALKRKNVETHLKHESYVLYEVDIRDFHKLEDIFHKERPDHVVHLAAFPDTRKSVKYAREAVEINVSGTANLLELSKEGIKNFVLASTASIYGNANEPPYKESDNSSEPISPYPASKKAAEVLAFTYNHNFDLPVICLRFFNVYGPRMRPGLVMPTWIRRIKNGEEIELSGKGVRERDFTYIDDIVEGVLLALETPRSYEIINLGNSRGIALRDMLPVLEEALGEKAIVKERPSTKPSAERVCADITKAKKLLGWEPKMELKEGLEELIRWIEESA